MPRLQTSLALSMALALSAGEAVAVGFDKSTPAAALGQTLDFVVGLRLEPNEIIEPRCVKAEVSFGDRLLADAAVRARIETARASGEHRVRVTTTLPVDEPVVGIQVHLGCSSTLSGNFLLFADPPARAAVVAPPEQGWASERAESPVSGVLAAATPPASTGPAAAGRAPAPRARKPATEPSATGTTAPRPSKRPAGETRPAGGAVLKLDPMEADALIFPSLRMATTLSEPGRSASGVVPSFVDPDHAQRVREQERLKALEGALLKLNRETEANQKALADMQLRVREAEAARYANPLVFLLSLLCVLLAAGVGVMWWLRRRDRLAPVWWTPPAGAAAAAPAATATAPESGSLDLSLPQSMPSVFPTESRPDAAPPLFAPLAPSTAVTAARSAEAESGSEPRRPMSAEELIDLEQQAEFFVVLGQDEAAIDLLMGHVRSTGGVSPLPYLKLLEIYRRREEREPYDRMRERFNRRFNAYAPEWGVDPEQGLSLEGYPEVMSRLQKAWDSPSQAMEFLDTSLFRRDAGPTFDVPAYRELLFLYGVSRDLAEHAAGTEGVDLLLPIENPAPAAAPSAPASFSLDLDVSTDQPPLFSLEERTVKPGRR